MMAYIRMTTSAVSSQYNNIGELPEGWVMFKDNTGDQWYQKGTITQWNRPQPNNTQPNNTQPNNTQPNNTQPNNTRRKQQTVYNYIKNANRNKHESKKRKYEQMVLNTKATRLRNLNGNKAQQNAEAAKQRAELLEKDAKEAQKRYMNIKKAFNVSQSRTRSLFRPTNQKTKIVLNHVDNARKAAKQAILLAAAAKRNAENAKIKANITMKVKANKEAALSRFTGYTKYSNATQHVPVAVMTEEELKRTRGWRPIINLKP